MESTDGMKYSVFLGMKRIPGCTRQEAAISCKAACGSPLTTLAFDEATGLQTDFDLRGSVQEVGTRYQEAPANRPVGRPKLGVVAREVTLLPSHWEWLNAQSGGASVALRKLVVEAKRANEGLERARLAKEATYRFISVLAGNLDNFEEASRALFAGDSDRFADHIRTWPEDVRAFALELSREIAAS